MLMLGSVPEIDEIFPPRPPPVKRAPPEDIQTKATAPVVTGAGFFSPDTGNGGNLFHSWKPDISQPQPFRMAPASRDSKLVYCHNVIDLFLKPTTIQCHQRNVILSPG